jgi:predicted dehydrogenase
MEGGSSEVQVVVVGYGFAGRRFHAPLVAATTGMHLYGIVARSPDTQQDARKYHFFIFIIFLSLLLPLASF